MSKEVQNLDFKGQPCPLPLLKTKQALMNAKTGAQFEVVTTDQGSLKDIPLYLSRTSHNLLKHWQSDDGCYFFLIQVV